ncbi:MAG: hypothetical protein Kow00109_12680 [Acidobacteriota bacterium]
MSELRRHLQRVRRRIRREWLLAGAAASLGLLLAAWIFLSWLLPAVDFSPGALIAARILLLCLAGGLAWRLVLRWFLRPPSLREVARFLEKRHPELKETVSAAVEIEAAGRPPHPFRDLLATTAARRLRNLPTPPLYWPRRSALAAAATAAFLALGAWLYWAGPPEFSYTLERLAAWNDEGVPPLYFFEVEPGDAVVAKGSDVTVRTFPRGFDPAEVRLMVRRPGAETWERFPMERVPAGYSFQQVLSDLRESVTYYVTADGVRSPEYRLDVRDFPRPLAVRFRLRFPEYTGLPDTVVENEQTIRALKGTRVEVRVEVDPPAAAGRLWFEDGAEVPLEDPEGRGTQLVGEFGIEADTSFRIQLANQAGLYDLGTDEYLVEATDDQPPLARVTLPGRDRPVTVLEEVYCEFEAEDDYGIRQFSLVYAVNGGEPQRVALPVAPEPRRVAANYTFYLEEWEQLEPGDFISYYVEAADAIQKAASDLYFLEVEPFERSFRQMQAMGGMGGGEGMGFAARQKQVIIATHTLIQQPGSDPARLAEDAGTLALVQERIRSEVEAVKARIDRRNLGDSNPRFGKMAEYLDAAIEHMQPAADALRAVALPEALPAEQQAYQMLSRAEKLFTEIQVAFSSASDSTSAQDLADLVDLELDRTKNQYETLQQARRQRQEESLDDALERLRRLAQRQQRELERRRRQGGGAPQSGEIQEEVERLARELARLSRERNDPRLNQISRQLERLSRSLRGTAGSQQQSLEQATRALEQLEQARRRLEEHRSRQLEGQLDRMAESARQLAREQRELAERMERTGPAEPGGEINDETFQQLRELFWRQQDLRQAVQQLESGLHGSARRLEDEAPAPARTLRQAGRAIREQRIPDQMQEAAELLAGGLSLFAARRAEEAARQLEEIASRIQEAVQQARNSISSPEGADPTEALAQAGRLIERLQALEEKLAQARSREGEGQVTSPTPAAGEDRRDAESRRGGETGSPRESARDDTRQPGDPGDESGFTAGEPVAAGVQQGSPTQGPPRGGPARLPGSIPSPDQLAREWNQRVEEARELQRSLRGIDPGLAGEVSRLIQQMQQVRPAELLVDSAELERLRTQLIAGFQEAELELLRRLPGRDEAQARNALGDEVPTAYRERVQEYFRRLSELAEERRR